MTRCMDVVRDGVRQLAALAVDCKQPRRVLLAGVVCALAALALSAPLLKAQDRQGRDTGLWAATWGSAPAGPPPASELLTLENQTLRLIVHTSTGGTQVRIRLSNELGSAPLHIGAARVALGLSGAATRPGTDRALTFGGRRTITIPPGAPALSDPVALDVPALSDLAVSLYLPARTSATTVHPLAYQSSYVSTAGDFTGSARMPTEHTITSWPFLTEVDMIAPVAGVSVVALGDSITDGVVTTVDANQRWPDFLARRLQTARGASGTVDGGLPELTHRLAQTRRVGVVNRGISGNRLLRGWPGTTVGDAALVRFDRDVLATAGVQYVIVLLGINDIGVPGVVEGEEPVSADELIAGYRQLIARARTRGLAIYGGTLTPFEGSFPGYYTPEKDQVRQAVNRWIRSSGEFDAVIDFERAIRDPARPTRMLPAYDSGDHLHPNDRGMEAMANAIPLDLFRPVAFPGIRQQPRE